jgi:hypothetical protein
MARRTSIALSRSSPQGRDSASAPSFGRACPADSIAIFTSTQRAAWPGFLVHPDRGYAAESPDVEAGQVVAPELGQAEVCFSGRA